MCSCLQRSPLQPPEPSEERLTNPARVLPAQLPLVSIPPECRYQPVVRWA